jgi:hypothetical protein|tara:strand:+ start:224 stop:415 length:192 start_codon:yes stop_codon:yes gene_type:complete
MKIEHNPNGFDSWVRPIYLGRKIYRIIGKDGYPEVDSNLKRICFETKKEAENFINKSKKGEEL